MNISELVKAVAPEMPTDRKVIVTMDWSAFFKIDYSKRVLYVPSDKALRMNATLIDPFTEAVKAFANSEMVEPDWSLLTYDEDCGSVANALLLLEQIPSEGYIACDIESRNTSFKDNKVIAISFCWEETHAIVISALEAILVQQSLQAIFARPNIHWIWQNGKFDIGMLKFLYHVDARVDEDTMLQHYVGINEHKGTHGLKDMGALYLQAPDWDAELDRIKKDRCRELKCKLEDFDYEWFPSNILHKYASFDVIITRRLYFCFKDLMRPDSNFIYRKLIEASNIYSLVERNGVRIDMDYLEDLEFDLERQIVAATKHFDEAIAFYWNPTTFKAETGAKSAPKEFNLGSPAQLKWLLQKVTSEAIADTRKETIDDLIERLGDSLPVMSALRDLRKFNKYMDTYITGFRNLLCSDGRIHGTYKLHGTETGRLSAADPNMQNIPRDKQIKNLFVASPGTQLVQLDYSQAELRVLAYLSQDTFLKSVYQEGKDLHDAVATQMFGPGFTKEQRVQAKTINFGIAYGRGPANIMTVFRISFSEAQNLINNWFKQMPMVKEWIERQHRYAFSAEAPRTLLGRERHFILTSDNVWHIQNECVNFPIQSIASDMTMFSLLAIMEWIVIHNLSEAVKIIITVHDSIVLEVKDDPALIKLVATECQNIMATTPAKYLTGLDFPFRADVEVGYKWGDMHEMDD